MDMTSEHLTKPVPHTEYLMYTLRLTLEEMYNGTTRRLGVNKCIVCDECNGSGSAFEVSEDSNTYGECEECEGVGVLEVVRKISPDSEKVYTKECELCWGMGTAVIPEERCRRCNGRRILNAFCALNINVRPGSRHGQKLIYGSEGNQVPDMRPGNLIVILEELKHHVFKRTGNDLFMTMKLSLADSLCGFDKIVTTLDKRRLVIRIPRGKVVPNLGYKCVINEGMPIYENPQERGRLIIQFKVNIPNRISSVRQPILEKILPPRENVNIPMEATECYMDDFSPDVDDAYECCSNPETNGRKRKCGGEQIRQHYPNPMQEQIHQQNIYHQEDIHHQQENEHYQQPHVHYQQPNLIFQQQYVNINHKVEYNPEDEKSLESWPGYG